MLYVISILVQCHANVSKQTTLLDGVDVGPPKGHVNLNRSVHGGLKDNTNVKVHLEIRSGSVSLVL